MDLLIAATPHAHVTRPSSRNPGQGLDEQLAVVKVRTICPAPTQIVTLHTRRSGAGRGIWI